MEIGIDASRSLRAILTGTERYSLEITRHLLALPAASAHAWRLYTDDDVDLDALLVSRKQAVHNAEICVLDARPVWTHRALGPEVIRRPPDVLFVPAHVLPFSPRRRLLPPSVITVHDLGFRHFPEAHTPRQRWYLEAGTRWSAHAATAIICVSEATARDLQDAYGTPAQKIHVVHEAAGIQPQLLSKGMVADVCTALGLQRPFALFLGTIQPRKNLRRLMEAYAVLAAQHDLQWDLVLAGNLGWLSESLQALPATLELADRIHLTGYISEDERVALLQAADFFCFPSLHEGFGLPVLEAQQLGVPVMTSNNSSLPEVAGDAALLVDPNDTEAMAAAMLRLSQDETLRQELIAAGHENVKRFSWDKAAAETLAVLEAAAAQGNQ